MQQQRHIFTMNFTLQETLEVQVFFHLLVLRSMKTLSSYQRKIELKKRGPNMVSSFRVVYFVNSNCTSQKKTNKRPLHSVWKSPKMSHLNFTILALCTNLCPIKSWLSGNTVCQVASCFQKLALFRKRDFFCDFQTPCHACRK